MSVLVTGGAGFIGSNFVLNLIENSNETVINFKNVDIFEFADEYAFGIANAQAFVEGNKRTAFVTSVAS